MIVTDRLNLTPPTVADFDESFAMLSDPQLLQFIGAGTTPTRSEAWTKLLRNVGHWSAFGYGIFTVRDRRSGAFVGEVGVAHFERGLGERFDPNPEAAWILLRSEQGKGLAFEAVDAVHRWFDARRASERSVCIIHPNNAASIRIAEKVGYRRFGEGELGGAPIEMFERSALTHVD